LISIGSAQRKRCALRPASDAWSRGVRASSPAPRRRTRVERPKIASWLNVARRRSTIIDLGDRPSGICRLRCSASSSQCVSGSPHHRRPHRTTGDERLFQGVSGEQDGRPGIGFLAASLAFLLLASSGQGGPQFIVAAGRLRCRRLPDTRRGDLRPQRTRFILERAPMALQQRGQSRRLRREPREVRSPLRRLLRLCRLTRRQGARLASWRVVGGKLYVNFSQRALELWLEDVAGHIAAADRNWPKLNAN
jgi:hypothetical protein